MMTSIALPEIMTIVRPIAWGAGDILRAFYRGSIPEQGLAINEKKDGPVTAADLASNHYILEHLHQAFPREHFGYLSEETYNVQEGKALLQEWVWIIDPLDGTRDFIDKTGEYAIHIALTYQQQPVLAVVVVPEAEKLYFAMKGEGSFLETRDGKIRAIFVSPHQNIEDLSLVASRTHRDERMQFLVDQLAFKERHYVGSVGCKIAHIVEQKSDVYISLSGKSAPKDWDFAAPELILTEAGGKFTHFEGHPLKYNQGDVHKWGGIMASNGGCHEQLCQQSLTILQRWDQGI